MKKKKFSLFFLAITTMFFTFASPYIEYEVIREAELTQNPIPHYRVIKILQKGEILNNNSEFLSWNEKEYGIHFIKAYTDKGESGCINVEDIKVKNSSVADERLKKGNWIAKYCIDSIYKNDINIIFENEGNIEKYVQSRPVELDHDWPWQDYMDLTKLYVNNLYINISFSINNYLGLFNGIDDKFYNLYDYSVWNYTKNKYTNRLKEDQKHVLTYSFDGDYLNVFIDDEFFMIFVNVDKNLEDECIKFIKGKTYNISKVIWPRHADGSCDYEPTQKTLFTLESIMTVKENLKLRSEEATSSEVLTVMSEGAKVQILEIGKSDIIGGIKSNWVKVKIQKGSRTPEGHLIRPGLIGWCYGGYLE